MTEPRDIRERLRSPRDLCAQLGLLEGPPGRKWARQMRDGVFVLCPWHSERTPSCSVTTGPDGTVRAVCHACGETGDAIGLVAAVHGIDLQRDFREALAEAAVLAGVRLDDPTYRPRQLPVRPPPPPEPPPLDSDTFDAMARWLLAKCPLVAAPGVARYLNDRRLGKLALHEGWGALPADPGALEGLRQGAIALFGADAWARSGLAVRDGRRAGQWAWSSHRLVIPWRTREGIATLQRRVLGEPPHGVGKYIFASGRSPALPYGVDDTGERLEGRPMAVFVEGAVDVLAMRALCAAEGKPALVYGLPGVSAWRAGRGLAWAELARGKVAVIALDIDASGTASEAVERAAAQMIADLGAAGAVRVDRWRPAKGKDWAEVWRAGRPVVQGRRVAA